MNTSLVKEISSLIVKCDYEELKTAQKMISSMKKKLDEHYSTLIKVGNIVVFEYRGKMHSGKVIRVNKKTITIIETESKREVKVSIYLIVSYAQKQKEN